MPFRPNNAPHPHAEMVDAINPYASNNPTVLLPQNNRHDPNDTWLSDQPIAPPAPDVVPGHPLEDLYPVSGRQLHAATEDLWAVSAPAIMPDRGEWQLSEPHDGQSDFLVMDAQRPGAIPMAAAGKTPSMSQPLATIQPVSRQHLPSAPVHPVVNQPVGTSSQPLQSRPISGLPMGQPVNCAATSHSGRVNIPVDDPLRPICLAVSVAIEKQLEEQGEQFPLERTPERVELVRRLARNYLRRERALIDAIPDAAEGERLLNAIVDETLGFGPLDPLMRDETITEILVTGPRMTYVEQGGRLYEVPVHFEDDNHLLRTIHRILGPQSMLLTPRNPIADVRLPDGTRINVVMPPSAVSGPTLTIRRSVRRIFTLEQLVRMDVLSLHMADFLRQCVNARLNILISGGPGSGKTTLLNALASTIDDADRIVKIEETSELQLHQRHIVPLEIRLPGPDGQGSVAAAELVRNALRMRSDRMLLGECRGPEALALVQAMNGGYDGTMTTIYAVTPRDALQRMEALCAMAGTVYAPAALRQQLATGIDIIVHCTRLRDGGRRVTQITDVVGMEGEAIMTADLFAFREAGVDMSTGRLRGDFYATGMMPTFAGRIEDGPLPLYPNNTFARGA